MFATSGHRDENVILLGVIVQIWTRPMKMAGSGAARVLKLVGSQIHRSIDAAFWTSICIILGPTSQRNTGDWSYTGGYGQAQPDNREAAQGMLHENYFYLFFFVKKKLLSFLSFVKVIANFPFFTSQR